jgi:hypothetical protein
VSAQQRQRDQEQQQAFAEAIRNGQENQRLQREESRRQREESKRAVAELAEQLQRARIKPEVKPEVQQAVAAVQDVVVRVVIPDGAGPVRQVVRVPDGAAPRRPLIIRRREFAAARKEETEGRSTGKRVRDSDDNATNTVAKTLFSGVKAIRTFFMGQESTDKWVREGVKKMLEDGQL